MGQFAKFLLEGKSIKEKSLTIPSLKEIKADFLSGDINSEEFMNEIGDAIDKAHNSPNKVNKKIINMYMDWNDGEINSSNAAIEIMDLITESVESMTFGHMPKFEKFEKAFDRETAGSKYHITAGASGAGSSYEGSYTAEELYKTVKKLKDSENEEDTDMASSIMQTLGFEWI